MQLTKRTYPILFLLVGLLLSSCQKEYIQVYDTEAGNADRFQDQWVYENDTVEIRYSFWARGGIMSFAIYNKSDRQLYLDWKNSSFILNDRKLVYWIDETRTSTVSSSKSKSTKIYNTTPAAFDWGYVLGSMTTNSGASISEGSMVKDERITSVPPHAYIGLQQYELLDHLLMLDTAKVVKVRVARNDNPKESTVVTRQHFTPTDSPLRFRNYLMLSFSEDMKDPFQTDNAFWLSDAMEMEYLHFQGKALSTDAYGTVTYDKPFKKRTAFYRRYKYK